MGTDRVLWRTKTGVIVTIVGRGPTNKMKKSYLTVAV